MFTAVDFRRRKKQQSDEAKRLSSYIADITQFCFSLHTPDFHDIHTVSTTCFLCLDLITIATTYIYIYILVRPEPALISVFCIDRISYPLRFDVSLCWVTDVCSSWSSPAIAIAVSYFCFGSSHE